MWKARGRGNDYRNLSPRRASEIAAVLPQFPPANAASKLERSFSESSAAKRSMKDRQEIRSRVDGKRALIVEMAPGFRIRRKIEQVSDSGCGGRRCGKSVNHYRSVAAVERGIRQVPVGRNHDHEHDDEHSQQEQHARSFYVPLRHARILCLSWRRKSTPKRLLVADRGPFANSRWRAFGGSRGPAVQYRSLLWVQRQDVAGHWRGTLHRCLSRRFIVVKQKAVIPVS